MASLYLVGAQPLLILFYFTTNHSSVVAVAINGNIAEKYINASVCH